MKPIPVIARNLSLFFVLFALFSLIFINEIDAASCAENEHKKSQKCSDSAVTAADLPSLSVQSNPPVLPAQAAPAAVEATQQPANTPQNSLEQAVEPSSKGAHSQAADDKSAQTSQSASASDAFQAVFDFKAQFSATKFDDTQNLFDGCSHGFWKTHSAAWVGYSTTQTLENVFDMPDSLDLDNATLMDALNFTGGSGDVGAARNLMRQAVGMLLNASHPIIYAPLTVTQVITLTNTALASGISEMHSLTVIFDGNNNLGCPINGKEDVPPVVPPVVPPPGTTTPPGNGTTTPPDGGGNGTTTPPGNGTTTPPGGGNGGGGTVGNGGGGSGGNGGGPSFMPGGSSNLASAGAYFGGAGGSIGGGQLPNDSGGLLNPIMLPDAGIGPDYKGTTLHAFLIYLRLAE